MEPTSGGLHSFLELNIPLYDTLLIQSSAGEHSHFTDGETEARRSPSPSGLLLTGRGPLGLPPYLGQGKALRKRA